VTRVGRSIFARQMGALARAGWRTLSLGDLATGEKRFFLSFDDGYASLADFAYPLLADLGFTATTFLITDFVGKANTWDVRYTWKRLPHLDWPEIERWRTRGFGFGSHGATHRRLTWLPDAAAADELSRSRRTLVERLGPDAGRAVAYPFGALDARIERLAGAAGYELGFGGVKGDPDDPLHLPRVPVYLWDVGSTPLGLREDALGALGRAAAHAANRCAVGTSLMLRLAGLAS
jgi:peptidoglycan/xylan/chitin deacetylase (PgdA/CDA1 family)